MQSICSKFSRLLYEVARPSPKMFFSMEKQSRPPVSIVPPAPVRPVNAFFRYLKEKLTQDAPKQVDYQMKDKVSKIAIEWKALPIDKKQIYEIEYAKDINKFKIIEEKWWNGLTENQKQQYKNSKTEKRLMTARRKLQKEISSLGKPKCNVSALNFYIRQNMSQKDSTNVPDFRKLMTTLSNKWTTLSVKEKKIYNEMAEEDAIRYKRELAFWNLKILTEGKGHLLQLRKNLQREKRLEKKKRIELDAE